MNNYFLSCDWGSTAFRLRLVDASGHVIAEERAHTGITATYKEWQQTTQPRASYFAAVINRYIDALAARTGLHLQDVPVILSGMASSSIGMVELPYKQLPFRTDGSDLSIHTFDRFLIISGVCSENDVMRGEETKIVGCGVEDQWLLMPGTHPKHVLIKDGQVTHFQTFMTGEFFDLLSGSSILAASVNNEGTLDDPAALACFTDGLHAGSADNILHAAFRVRTNQLLKKIAPAHNQFYLSGLLIGAELKAIDKAVTIVAGSIHGPLYSKACGILNIPVKAVIDADEALIRGQQALIKKASKQ